MKKSSFLLILLTINFFCLCSFAQEELFPLLEKLHHPDWQIREEALISLKMLGNQASSAIPDIIEYGLKNEFNSRLAYLSAETLIHIQGESSKQQIIDSLLTILQENKKIQLLKLPLKKEWIIYLGLSEFPELGEEDKKKFEDNVVKILEEFEKMRSEKMRSAKTDKEKLRILLEKGPQVKIISKYKQWKFQVEEKDFFIDNEENMLVFSKNLYPWYTRERAIWILGQLQVQDPRFIPLLINCLEDENDTICFSAAFTLGQIKKSEQEIVLALMRVFPYRNELVQKSIIQAFTKIGVSAEPAVPLFLKKLIWDEEFTVLVLNALEKTQSQHPSIPFTFSLALHYGKDEIRLHVLKFIGKRKIQDAFLLSILLKELNQNFFDVRLEIIKTFGELKTSEKAVLEEVLKLLQETTEKRMILTLLQTIGKIGKPMESAVPILKEFLKKEDIDIQKETQQTLRLILESDDK